MHGVRSHNSHVEHQVTNHVKMYLLRVNLCDIWEEVKKEGFDNSAYSS